MPKITSSKIIYDSSDWLGGLNPQYGLSGVLGNDFQLQRAIDPYRYYGYLSPGYLNVGVTNESVLGSVIRNGVNNGGYAYLIEGGTKLHRMLILTGELLNDSGGVGFPHTITAHGGHSAVLGRDCVLYDAKVGGTSAKRFFYCWSDNTDWDIGVCDMDITTPTFDDDFMTTAPATPLSGYDAGKDYVHPMVVGADDILYIGDRNYLHAYDGQNAADDDGKFFPAVLTLPTGWIITGMAKLSESLVVFAYYSASGSRNDSFYYGESKAFFWDYLSSDPYRIKNLNDNTVVDGFEYLGTVACITSGRPDGFNTAKVSRLQIFDGSEFREAVSFIGDPPIRGGIDIIGRQIRWLSVGTAGGWQVHAWRNNFDNDNKLNIISEVSGGELYTVGMLRTFSQQLCVGSTGKSDDGNLEKLNTNFNANSLFYTSTTDIPKRIRVTSVTVKFRNTTANRAFSLSIGDRGSSIYTIISNLSTITSSNIIKINTGLDTSGNKIPPLDSIRLIGQWSSSGGTDDGTTAPIISSIEIDYEPVEFI